MMHFPDTITIIVAGLMVGTELAVTAFFTPAGRRLDSSSTAGSGYSARSLRRVMPVWMDDDANAP